MSDKRPILFYWEEAYDAWFPLNESLVGALEEVLDWPDSYTNGEEFELRLKRIDMTAEELNDLPEA